MWEHSADLLVCNAANLIFLLVSFGCSVMTSTNWLSSQNFSTNPQTLKSAYKFIDSFVVFTKNKKIQRVLVGNEIFSCAQKYTYKPIVAIAAH